MSEIERLKEEEKQQLAAEDVFVEEVISAETVEYLKIEEAETRAPARQSRRKSIALNQPLPGWARLAVAGGVLWAVFAAGNAGFFLTNWWALFLIFPLWKNLQSVAEDRRRGIVTRQTRKSLTGAMLAGVFTFAMLSGSWGLMWPMLLIGWGISMVLINKWRSEQYI